MSRNSNDPNRVTPLTRRALPLLLAALLLTAPALAQVSYELGGELSADFGVAVDGYIPVAAAGLTLELSGEVGSGFFPDATFLAELHAEYDAADPASPFSARLGRAYATAYLGPIDLSVGNQIVSWGSTDALSPVDVLNPRDLSYPVSDPASQRLAVPMIRAVAHADGGVTVDLVVIPVFVASEMPGPRWQPAPELPPGVTVVGVADPVVARPALEVNNVQFGVRATLDLNVGGGADVSTMYYRGFRHLPSVTYLATPTQVPGQLLIQPLLSYDPIQVLGLDFSAVVGQFVLRGEAAYTFTGDPATLPGGLPAPVGTDTLAAVLGIETNVPGGPFVSLQAMYQHSAAGPAPAPGAPPVAASDTFSTAAVATYEPNNRMGLDMAWLHSWSDGSGALRPSLSYTFTDGLVGTAEAAVFYGAAGSEYGAWRDNSQFRASVAFSF